MVISGRDPGDEHVDKDSVQEPKTDASIVVGFITLSSRSFAEIDQLTDQAAIKYLVTKNDDTVHTAKFYSALDLANALLEFAPAGVRHRLIRTPNFVHEYVLALREEEYA